VRLFVLSRHAETTLNHEHRINGDPSLEVGLTTEGEAQARLLGAEVAGIAIELAVHTRFGRTRMTAALALEGRGVSLLEEPLFDDIDVGELEGRTIEDYRAWKRAHTRRVAGRLPRDPDSLRAERGRRIRRSRRAGACDPERVALPVRRRGAGARSRADRAADRSILMESAGVLPFEIALRPQFRTGRVKSRTV